MIKFGRSAVSAVLMISLLTFIEIPVSHAADCAVTNGVVSGNTRYTMITTGTACTWSVPVGVTSLSYLVVGGGGGGGGARAAAVSPNLGAGGGGAGGMVLSSTLSVSSGGILNLTIGTGGSAGAATSGGGNGTASSLTYSASVFTANGGNGGGGASGSSDSANLSGDGGSNTGYTGGNSNWDGGGGGAGASANGVDGTDIGGQGGNGGNGGAGVGNTLLTGSTIYYGGGGGGGGTPATNSSETSGTYGTGGSGVGGNGGGYGGGGANDIRQPTAPTANSGGGGGGGGWRYAWSDAQRAGTAGADGVIILTYTKNAATISNIRLSSTPAWNNTYGFGDGITVEVTFSETVTITGTPRIPILGLSSKYYNYYSGTGTPIIIFRYTPVASDYANTGIGVTANTLELNSGSIADSVGLAATLTHVAIAISSTQRVDVVNPALTIGTSVSINENTSAVQIMTANETVTWSVLPLNDWTFFTINSATGELTISPRDFENYQDATAPYNQYIARVRATDYGRNLLDSYIYVTILNVQEYATISAPSISGGAIKGTTSTITVTTSNAGRVQFSANGKRIPKCVSVATTGSSPNFSATCSWKPAVSTQISVTATITPNDSFTVPATSTPVILQSVKRTTKR